MKPFLDCYIWSISDTRTLDEFYLIHRVYKYNSLKDGIIDNPPGFIQIPDFCINSINLLEQLDYTIVEQNKIPIIKKTEDERWEIDLKYYEHYINNQS